jgi:hypothetical protein
MGNIVNIAFQGGTHGHYLRFCIDKFSKLTPELIGTPFTKNNTLHNTLKYSGSVNRYHPEENYPHFQNTSEPHILITVDEEDLLFLERWVTMRAGDFNVDVSEDLVSVHLNFLQKFPWIDKFKKYYNIDLTKKSIPKFIMRDFYKLSFIDPDKNGFVMLDKVFRENKPSNTFEFPVSCFWDKDKFIDVLEKINEELNLKIDINGCLSTHGLFLNKLNFLETKYRASEVTKAIQNKKDIDIQNLDTVEQAYVSAWIEKNHEFVIVPLCNKFFNTTGEIINWLEHYPQHYKAMNPNLPTFNNIPNPFHLWNLKK